MAAERQTALRSSIPWLLAVFWVLLAAASVFYLYLSATGGTLNKGGLAFLAPAEKEPPPKEANATEPATSYADQIAALERTIGAKDSEIVNLKSRLSEVSTQLAALNDRMAPIEKFMGPLAALPTSGSVTTSPPAPGSATPSSSAQPGPPPSVAAPPPSPQAAPLQLPVMTPPTVVPPPAPPAPTAPTATPSEPGSPTPTSPQASTPSPSPPESTGPASPDTPTASPAPVPAAPAASAPPEEEPAESTAATSPGETEEGEAEAETPAGEAEAESPADSRSATAEAPAAQSGQSESSSESEMAALVAPNIPPGTTRFGIELGTVDRQDAIRTMWRNLQTNHAALVAGLQARRIIAPDKKWRLIAGPFSSAAEAAQACSLFKKADMSCEATVFAGDAL